MTAGIAACRDHPPFDAKVSPQDLVRYASIDFDRPIAPSSTRSRWNCWGACPAASSAPCQPTSAASATVGFSRPALGREPAAIPDAWAGRARHGASSQFYDPETSTPLKIRMFIPDLPAWASSQAACPSQGAYSIKWYNFNPPLTHMGEVGLTMNTCCLDLCGEKCA